MVQTTTHSPKPRILIICVTDILGGGEMHTLGLYAKLRDKGYHAVMLVAHKSKFDQYLTQRNIPHHTTHAYKFRNSFLRPLYHVLLKRSLRAVCKKENISIITCNCTPEVPDALSLKKILPVRVVFTRHCMKYPKMKYVKNLDALVVVNQNVAMKLQTKNDKEHLNVRYITCIPPMFDEIPFLNYKSTETRESFFNRTANITVGSSPVITMIANLYKNLGHKNHPLLFKAIHYLVHEKKKPVHVMLAGDGVQRGYLENMVKDLHLEEYVHFLGFVKDTPALLYHSDFLVHTSIFEAFGIIYLEAALMHKPAIGAYQTAAQDIILHEQTGLLFKNNDVLDLATQIERLVGNKAFTETMGHAAYEHVMKNFAPDVTVVQYEKIYQMLQSGC